MLKFLITLIISITTIINPKVSQAQTITFFDDFSQGLTKWQSVRDNGDKWNIVNEQLEAFIDRGSYITELVPKDEFWDSNLTDFELEFDFIPLAGADKNFSFNWRDLRHWYEAHFSHEWLSLIGINGSNLSFGTGISYPLINGLNYHFKLSYVQGQIKFWINENLIIQIFDDSFHNDVYGKIGLKASTGSVWPTIVKFDNVVVRSINNNLNFLLNVPLLKQTDSRWSYEIYDSAEKWSQMPTIKRWGCLLTSITMVLNYHQINTLPSGKTLNPLSLNEWLISQVDGYVGEGLINWIAITRLVAEINQHYGTTKLEYSLNLGPDIITSINQIKLGIPTILQINKHFLVATGHNNQQTDLMINDPWFDFNRLSQHQTELISTRVLAPSMTDLSYLLIVYPNQLNLKITNSDGNELPSAQITKDQIGDIYENSGEINPGYTTWQIAKPNNLNLSINFNQDELKKYQIDIFAYDTKANPTNLSQSGIVGKNPLKLKINYLKNDISQIQPILSIDDFKKDLLTLFQNKDIYKSSIYKQLDKLASYAIAYDNKNTKLRYLNSIETYLIKYQNYISINGYDYLIQQINTLKDIM